MPLKSLVLWLVSGAIAACVVSWIAAQVHLSGHAPVGWISAGAGVLLGLAVAWLAGLNSIHCYKRLVVGTLLIAVLAVTKPQKLMALILIFNLLMSGLLELLWLQWFYFFLLFIFYFLCKFYISYSRKNNLNLEEKKVIIIKLYY